MFDYDMEWFNTNRVDGFPVYNISMFHRGVILSCSYFSLKGCRRTQALSKGRQLVRADAL